MKNIFPVLLTVYILFYESYGGPQYPVSKTVKEIDTLAAAEIQFAQDLNETLPSVENQTLAIKYLKSFLSTNYNLKGYKHHAGELKENVKAVNSNPIGIFHMVRRFYHELNELKEHLLQSTSTASLVGLFPADLWFTNMDLNQTMMDIIVICHAYNLNVKSFADGIVQGVDFGTKLSAKDCYEIGRFAEVNSKPAISVMFLEEAVRKSPEDLTFSSITAEIALNESIKRHDKQVSNKSLEAIERQFLFNRKLGPLRKRYGELYKEYRVNERALLGRHAYASFSIMSEVQTTWDFPPYYELCEQGILQSEDVSKELFCWYETTLDPYWKINPLKMEIHSKNPELIQIYDIIGKKKRQFLKDVAIEKGFVNPGDVLKNIETIYIPEREHPEIATIVLDIEKITGLDLTSPGAAQNIRVASNTPGSTFHAHMDRTDLEPYTDTASTFLYYLGQPELGGATAFVFANISITPVEGSAIYWISTLINGDTDQNTEHGGCPVIYGRKWVASKFINYAPQFLNMKYMEGVDEVDMDYQLPMFPKSRLLQQRFYSKGKHLKL